MGFLKDIKNNVLTADGAMGTLLYSYGVGNCFEEINLSHPEQIKNIHKTYIQAGAQVIQTNTYRANYEKLTMYGLEDKVKEINTQAVRLANSAVKEAVKEAKEGKEGKEGKVEKNRISNNTYVFGTIGGIRGLPGKTIPLIEIKRSFREQLYCLLLEKVDGILLETYYDIEELRTVLKIARKETNLPIVAQVTLHDVGLVQGGLPLADTLLELEELGADVIGLNCRLGPYHMTKSLESISLPEHAYLSAYPNASLPSYQDGRYQYSSNALYFEKAAISLWEQGVRLIGGCCGTTPDHISAIRKALTDKKPLAEKRVKAAPQQEALKAHAEQPSIVVSSNLENAADPPLLQELPYGQTSVIVELDPPKTLVSQRFFEGAQALKETGIDALTLADNSLATPRICNKSMAILLKYQLNMRSIVHVTCRDRNLIGLQSHLMGLSTLGIDQVLAITGDPAKVGDFPGATSVYDLSSFELIQLIKQCNQGMSFSGKPLGSKTNFTVAAAFNPNVRYLEKAVKRLEKKIECGADYFMTQPIYSHEQIEQLYDQTKHVSAPIYVGIMPLTGYRNAEFLHHEVPGIKLTDEIREVMEKFKDDPERSKIEGVAIAKSLIDTALRYFNRIYLITPFMRYDMTVELTEYIRSKDKIKKEQKRTVMRRDGDDRNVI